MANRKIDVELSLIDNFTQTFGKSLQAMTSMSKQGIKIGKDIEKAGKQIASVGSSLTKSITLPIAGFATASAISFGEVDKSIKLVQSTMGEVKWATADLEEAIMNAAVTSVFSMQDAADASLNFARQGFDAKQAAEMLAPALSLAAGTATDLSEVTSGLGNTLKVFASQGLTAEEASNIFAKAQAQANTSVTELFDAMSVGSSIFSTVGWSMKDLAAITDVFGDNFISGSEGATAMKTGLAKLVSPAKDGAEWIKKLGLDFVNTDGTMKTMIEVQEQLHSAFSNLTDSQQMQAASALFGKNQMGKWLTLINTAPDALREYREALDDTTGTSEDMSESLLSGLGGSIEKLKSTFDVFKYSLGKAVAEPVKIVVDRITSLVDTFRNLDTSTQQQIVKWAGIAATVGPAIMIFGKVVTAVGTGVRMFNQFGVALKAAHGIMGLIASPVGIVVMAIAALVAVVLIVRQHMDVFRNSMTALQPAFESIRGHIQSIISKAQEIWAVIGPIAAKIADVLGVVITVAVGELVGYISSSVDTILTVVDSIITVLHGVIDFVTGVFTGNWERAWNGVGEILSGIVDGFSAMFKGTFNGIIGAINGFLGGLNGMKIPDWIPGIGGKTFNMPVIPQLATGTDNWIGGIAQVNERGGEIIDLPSGSRVYPHDKSIEMARQMAQTQENITIAKLADQIIIREEADIDRIGEAIARRIRMASKNRGAYTVDANMA